MKRFITIRPIESRDREYFAYFKDDFLKSTFSVCFKDDILGAVALNRFFEMVKSQYSKSEVELELKEERYQFRSPALLDVLSAKKEVTT
jgi:hypothetical protein